MKTQSVELHPAASVSRADFIHALNNAYADYTIPIHLTEPSFEQLVQREDIRLESSAAALRGDQIVGMGLLAARGDRGWIGGMGVIPEVRHQGIGRRMMGHLINEARRLGLARLQLEVITQNKNATALYRSVGFKRVRHLGVMFTGDRPSGVRQAAGDEVKIEHANPSDLLERLPELAATTPPWQHDITSMWRVIEHIDGLAAQSDGGEMAGLCLWSGGEEQAGVLALAARSAEIGGALLNALRRRLPEARLNYMNVPGDDPMLPALIEAGFQEALGQHEMALELA